MSKKKRKPLKTYNVLAAAGYRRVETRLSILPGVEIVQEEKDKDLIEQKVR